MEFSKNQLIAGKCWIDRNFPDVQEVDIAYLKARFDMPDHAAAYIRQIWFVNIFVKKPFKNSEIYTKNQSPSSSSLYTE